MRMPKSHPVPVPQGAHSIGNRFGALAVRSHMIQAEHLGLVLARQQALLLEGNGVPRMGEMMIDQAFMTADQVDAVLRKQSLTCKDMFGRIALRRRLCSKEEIDGALLRQKMCRTQNMKVPRLGRILVESGALKPHQIQIILKLQFKSLVQCPGCQRVYNAVGLKPGSRLRCPRCAEIFVPLIDPIRSLVSGSSISAPETVEQTLHLPALNVFRPPGAAPHSSADASVRKVPPPARNKRCPDRQPLYRRREVPQWLSPREIGTQKVEPVGRGQKAVPMQRDVPRGQARRAQDPAQASGQRAAVSQGLPMSHGRHAAMMRQSDSRAHWTGLMAFGAGSLMIILAVIILGAGRRDTNSVKPEKSVALKDTPPPSGWKNRTSHLKPAAGSRAANPARAPKAAQGADSRIVPRPALAPLSEEGQRLLALGRHLINEARTCVRIGQPARAQELYRTVIGECGAPFGAMARAELTLLSQGRIDRISAPSDTMPDLPKTPEPKPATDVPGAVPIESPVDLGR